MKRARWRLLKSKCFTRHHGLVLSALSLHTIHHVPNDMGLTVRGARLSPV